MIGDGPERFYLQKISNANILFHGFLDYKDMLRIAKKSDYLVNPIKDGASQSVTNKLSDYILLSKPIISSQDSIEIKSFFDDNSYLIYKAGDVQDLTNKIEKANASRIETHPGPTPQKFWKELFFILYTKTFTND